MTILSVLGVYCFSRLRASYYGTKQSPTLLVVIEGASGSGKSCFKKLFELLATRYIQHDNECYNAQQEVAAKYIIQTLTSKITSAKYAQRLRNSQEVHTFMFNEEIDTVKNIFRGNGLGEDYLRLAFDNDLFDYDNKTAREFAGHYHIFNNFVFTGTPQTVSNFFRKRVENGDASRIVNCDIPSSEFEDVQYILPTNQEKTEILDELDGYHDLYTFMVGEDGDETACPETVIDLSYVQEALDAWGKEQEKNTKKTTRRHVLNNTDALVQLRSVVP